MVRSKIRLAILECDTPLPQTKKNYGGYGGVFRAMLYAGAQADGYSDPSSLLQLSMHQVEEDPENYPDPEEVDAVLVTGSRTCNRPQGWQWLTKSRTRFIRGRALDSETR